jgi:hypothetical protein
MIFEAVDIVLISLPSRQNTVSLGLGVIINNIGEEITTRDVLTQFSIYEHFTVGFLFFLTPPKYVGKLNIYEPKTPILDEV